MKKSNTPSHIPTSKQEKSKEKIDLEHVGDSFFKIIFEAHRAIMLLIDPGNGKIIDANMAAQDFYKYSKQELKSLRIQDINQLDPKSVRAEWRKALRDERNYFVFPHKLSDGQIRQVEVYSSSFVYEGKHLLYSIIHDITEKKIAEEALLKSEEKFEIAFKHNPNGIVLSDLKTGKIYEANEKYLKFTGYTREEIRNASTLDLDIYLNPDDRERMVALLKKNGSFKNLEIPIKNKKGDIFHVLAASEILKTSLGETILTTLQDITERKLIEDREKREHDLLNAIFDHVPAMISIYDPAISKVKLNRELERVTGWTKNDLRNRHIMGLAYPDPAYRKEIAEYMKKLNSGFKDIRMTCKDGTIIDTLWANVSIDDGRRIGRGIDITERKKVQEELLRSKNIINTALASMTDAVYIADSKGNLIEYNNAFYTFYRVQANTIFSKNLTQYYSFFEFTLPNHKKINYTDLPIPRALRGDTVKKTEYTIFRKDTGESWIGSFSFAPIRNNNQEITGAVVVARDVTETKKADLERERLMEQLAKEKEAVAESEERYRIMGDAINYGVWAADPEGKVTYLSESFCKLVGKNLDELKENGWYENMIVADSEEVMKLWKHSVKTGEPYEHEHRITSKEGETKYILARARPIRNQHDHITSWAGIHLDMTERRLASKKLEEQNQELIRINKLFEDFIHIAAHDLRSPIGNLLSLNELLIRTDDIGRKADLFNMSMPVVKRLQRTVDGLLEMVSLQMDEDIQPERINLKDTWNNMLEVLTNEISAFKGRLDVDFSEVPEIVYSSVHLTSILRNLVSNALKYTSGCEEPVINVCTRKHDNFVILQVSDNGIGIDLEKVKDGLFKPFRRFTKIAGGIGMGLYLIKNIIEKNGGTIEVKSEPGKGCTFTCYLKEYKIN